MDENETKEFQIKVINETAKFAVNYTILFYKHNPEVDVPIQFATGFLLEVGDLNFVISAAHVTDHGKFDRIYIGGSMNGGHIQLTSEDAIESVMPPSGDRIDDRVDFSIVRLSKRVCKFLTGIGKKFLPLSRVDRLYVSHQYDWLVVFGVPGVFSIFKPEQRLLDSKPFIYGGMPYDGRYGILPYHIEKLHLSVGCNQSDFVDDEGNPVPIPFLKGISGCGIWCGYKVGSGGAKTWSQDKIRLVAVQHKWDTNVGAIIGTHIFHVIGVIYANYPNLRPFLEKECSVKDIRQAE